jgi:lipooligosaccharide transport system ATP-binding protein
LGSGRTQHPARVAEALVVENLSKSYRLPQGGLFEAISEISFRVSPGECFGLLGPNGAGKSTTILCATGFYPPTGGRVLLDGVDVHAAPKLARRSLGVCSQEETLDTDFTAIDQLIRHAAYFRIPRAEGRRRAELLLRRFGLEAKAGQPIESLSGGMRRRLQVARAMVSGPRVLILDEPTTGLDPEVRRTLWRILGEDRARGVGILLSTHYMEEAERLCDRVAILSKGHILDVASPQELIRRHLGTEIVEEEVRPGVFWKRPPNLEDVYLKLTGSRLKPGEGEESADQAGVPPWP